MTTPRAVLRLLGVVAVAAVAGLLALVGVAVVSVRPAVFLGAGLAVFLAATAAGVVLSTRRLPWRRRGGPGWPGSRSAPWSAWPPSW